jgi:ATP-dependent RNA helicase MSS116, mitochondrial
MMTVTAGGTNMGPDKRAIDSKAIDILVATPGRMLAHMQETDGTVQMCSGVRVLVLDEADRLLDMGFKRDLDKIMSFLPRGREPAKGRGGPAHGSGTGAEGGVPRQTLLFSATFSEEVKQIAAVTLRQGYSIVDTVGEEVEQTHAHVPQHMMTVPVGQQIRALAHILQDMMRKQPNYKVMVFFPTAKSTAYMSALFNAIGIPVMEMHSRKTQV